MPCVLSEDDILSWKEIETRKHEIMSKTMNQFLTVFSRQRNNIKANKFIWGDEVEYFLAKFDETSKMVSVNLCSSQLFEKLSATGDDWKPEYAQYQLEGSPGTPYGSETNGLWTIEENLRHRRKTVKELLAKNEAVLTMTTIPLLGLPGSFSNKTASKGFIEYPDYAITKIPQRYKFLTENIEKRRGRNVFSTVPVWYVNNDSNGAEEWERTVNLNATGFGCGFCGIQVTIQAVDFEEACHLHDQLTNICPLMLAMTAATPVLCGSLVVTDTRWQSFCESVDDRTLSEEIDQHRQRAGPVASYLSPQGAAYSDLQINNRNEASVAKLLEAGIDSNLSVYMADLFNHDPLVIKRSTIINDSNSSSLFDDFCSSIWPSIRLKFPSLSEPKLGWRVEFRPMEVQLTDFENAAVSVFIVLLTRVILHFRLNFIIPLTKVDENFRRCQKMDAVLNRKLFFRPNTSSVEELTINQIVNGFHSFPGLVPLSRRYLREAQFSSTDTKIISGYLDFISGRANASLKTNARWMRDFIMNHPDYKHNSLVSDAIQFDLVKKIAGFANKDDTHN